MGHILIDEGLQCLWLVGYPLVITLLDAEEEVLVCLLF